MTQEELEHLLENVDWEPKADPLWAEASKQRLVAYADRVAAHRRHVRHWRLTLGSALTIAAIVLWWTQTAPLRTAIRATADVPPGVRLLQLTKENLPHIYEAGSWIGQAWNRVMVAVTPGARSAVALNAERDTKTGFVRADVRGTDGYVLVDPEAGAVVGTIALQVPEGAEAQQRSIVTFGSVELARQIAMADPVLHRDGYQAVSVASPKVYIVREATPSSSGPPTVTAQRPALPSGQILAVQLQREGDTVPNLTAVVDIVTRCVIQIVDSHQLEGLVVSEGTGTYAIIGKM